MTWEEITKKYDTENGKRQLLPKTPKLEQSWGRLLRSTDKLVWLFMLSNSAKPKPVKNS
ncbi:MAG: hypothetical protein NTX59_03810 [Elusimicrobia bacterium]|nr:hypothetical protein [Elusimicrobiota bacterium]